MWRLLLALTLTMSGTAALAQSMGAEQAKEREELENMRNEVRDIKSTINDAVNSMNDLNKQAQSQAGNHELHLFAKQAACELYSGMTADCLTYNGKIPGPPIRVPVGESVRIVLHNQLKVPTSLVFHGLMVPQSVGGLPKKDAGIVKPGEAYAYQFIPRQAGTYWYHPQVINEDQKTRGMYGALVVEPKSGPTDDKDLTMVLSELNLQGDQAARVAVPMKTNVGVKTVFLLNGKAAPAVPAMELRQGERVRLRVINASQHIVPLYLTGHRFEVVAINGSDALEPHIYRDTITVNPSDRIDLCFSADNPGVWSLASELLDEASNDGKFPGGIACVVRYSGMSSDQSSGMQNNDQIMQKPNRD